MLALPLELLIEVLKALEWPDLLRIRQVGLSSHFANSDRAQILILYYQTCRRLCHASQAIPVWQNLYRHYLGNSDIPCHLESRVCLYSAKDLESWVLRRIGADLGWKKNADRPSRQRIIQTGHIIALFLIPGGRWLIVADHACEVKCYDLDSPTISSSEQVLIPAGPIGRVPFCSAIDIPDDSVTFPFHLVIYQHVYVFGSGRLLFSDFLFVSTSPIRNYG